MTSGSVTDSSTRGLRSPLAGLAVLGAINLLNYADRYVLVGVQELIKRDPTLAGGSRDLTGALSDASLGSLAAAFFVVYMVASPFTGFLADRIARRHLVAGALVLWSAATIASGFAGSFSTLLLARALVGIGEAGYACAAPSLISDLFARDRRGRALGLFYAAIPLGAAIGYGVGGAMGASFGWRSAFIAAGLPGLLLAALMEALPEPQRGATDDPGARGVALAPIASLRALATNRGWLVTTAGMTLMTFATGGLAAWMPSFLTRSAGLSQAEAGLWFGAITATAGLLGALVGTLLGEAAQGRSRHGYYYVSGIGLALAAPLLLALAQHPGRAATLALAFVALFFAMLNTGPLNTALVNSAPSSSRASAVAANIFLIHLLGDGISPWLIGLVSDATGSLSFAIGLHAVPMLAAGAVLLCGPRLVLRASAREAAEARVAPH